MRGTLIGTVLVTGLGTISQRTHIDAVMIALLRELGDYVFNDWVVLGVVLIVVISMLVVFFAATLAKSLSNRFDLYRRITVSKIAAPYYLLVRRAYRSHVFSSQLPAFSIDKSGADVYKELVAGTEFLNAPELVDSRMYRQILCRRRVNRHEIFWVLHWTSGTFDIPAYVIYLHDSVWYGKTLHSAVVAAHELGHAIHYQKCHVIDSIVRHLLRILFIVGLMRISLFGTPQILLLCFSVLHRTLVHYLLPCISEMRADQIGLDLLRTLALRNNSPAVELLDEIWDLKQRLISGVFAYWVVWLKGVTVDFLAVLSVYLTANWLLII